MEAFARDLPAGARVLVTGMASSDGDPDFNRSLSCRRASDAADTLRAAGANVTSVKATGPIGAPGDPALRGVEVRTEGVPPLVFPAPPDPLPGLGPIPAGKSAPGFKGTMTPDDDFSGHSTTQFGVGEIIHLGFTSVVSSNPVFFGGLTWELVSGPGRVVVDPGDEKKGVERYLASDKSGNVQLRIKGGGGVVLDTKDFEVVAPRKLTMKRAPGSQAHTNSSIPRWSCAFLARIHLEPFDVSFSRIEVREGDATISATGWLSFKDGLHHCVGSAPGTPEAGTNKCGANAVSVGNAATGSRLLGCDTIGTGVVVGQEDTHHDTTKPFADGEFTWPIPWLFSVDGSAPKGFDIATAVATSDSAGTATIKKDGSEVVECKLDDPHSSLGPCT